MTPERNALFPVRVLTQQQREHYFEHGYVGVERLVPAEFVSVTNDSWRRADPRPSPGPCSSPEVRPLLLNCYSAGDAKACTPHPDPSSHAYEVVRGEPLRWRHHDPRPCEIPPDWSGGYTSIFAAQAGEDG